MMQFTYQFEKNSPKITVELSPETTLDEAVEGFQQFLLAAGYSMEGRVLEVQEQADCE